MTYKSNVLRELEWRGLIDETSSDTLDQALADDQLTLYCGFDPTSDSLQVGNLLAVMMLAIFRRHGHRVIALAGGATGRIGDPSGKTEERNLLDDDELQSNLDAIADQLRRVLDRADELHADQSEGQGADRAAHDVPVLDNADWTADRSFIDILRDVGKHFRVNQMINKESVRARLEEREQGISYTEFSYMVLQANDFLHLHDHHDCRLQIGGSDQWGNITAGIDLVRKKRGDEVFGLTAPLVTTDSGEKLGKTADGTVWLDPDKTSPYDFYQYWVRRSDEEVVDLLKQFTLLPREEIEDLEAVIDRGDNRGEVQEVLARQVTALVHGLDEAEFADRASDILFGEEIAGMTDDALERIFEGVPSTAVDRADLDDDGVEVRDLLVDSGLCDSRGAAKRLIKQGGAYLNNRKVDDVRHRATTDDLASESLLVIRSGKKDYALVRANP